MNLKTKYAIVIAVVVILMAGLALYLTKESSDNSTKNNQQVTVDLFQPIKDKMSNGTAMLVDVRTEEEFETGHINGATLVPLDTIKAGDYSLLPKNKQLYIYCRSGNRSAQATQALTQAGYESVKDLGSMEAVISMGATKAN